MHVTPAVGEARSDEIVLGCHVKLVEHVSSLPARRMDIVHVRRAAAAGDALHRRFPRNGIYLMLHNDWSYRVMT